MPALVAWLDASSEDQRRMREIVNLFSEKESRDELGIGQVRDSLSDTLFPGTSTLLTRARYLLMIPWCFTTGADRGRGPADTSKRVDDNERALIPALKAVGASDGLLGRVAGASLKNLPSSLYWVALRQFGILSSSTLDRHDAIELESRVHYGEDETESMGGWSPTLPPAPEGFPTETAGGFQLSSAEAGWLRDRILEGADGSMLAHFVEHRPSDSSSAPWSDEARADAAPAPARDLDHARLFSLAMNGAALVYNLLLAEAYETAGFNTMTAPVDRYREHLSDWKQDRDLLHDELVGWDRGDFWATVLAKNPNVAPNSRIFINSWLDSVIELRDDPTFDDRSRALILLREQQHKRSQSRLGNPKLLQSWQGASGARPLVFRWPQVQRILTDLHDGLERTDA